MQTLTPAPSDALVIFGITGDLAFKKIFPALENLERRGRLPEHRRGRGARRHRARGADRADAREPRRARRRHGSDAALRAPGGQAAPRGRRLPRRRHLRRAAHGARRRGTPLPLPRDPAEPVRRGRHAARHLRLRGRRAGGGREAARARPVERTDHQPRAAAGVRRGFDLPHRPLPRQGAGAEPALLPLRQLDHRAASGTATTSRACRSRWPRSSASRAAAACTRNSAPCATWCRTTCSRCWRSSRWSRRSARAPRPCATRRPRCCARSSTPSVAASCAGSTRATASEDGVARELRRRDLRRAALRHRLLALGRRAVLRAHRQAPAGDGHRGDGDLPASAAAAVRRAAAAARQLPALPARARPRRDRARHAHQVAGRGHDGPARSSSTPAIRTPTR